MLHLEPDQPFNSPLSYMEVEMFRDAWAPGWEDQIIKGHFTAVTFLSEWEAEKACVENRMRRCESPIERALGFALICRLVGTALTIDTQVNVGGYRVDLAVLTHADDETVLLAVECDGHDFHDKTKDQARRDKRRDRVLTSTGVPTLRFTGSEIYKSARACANEVAASLVQIRGRELHL